MAEKRKDDRGLGGERGRRFARRIDAKIKRRSEAEEKKRQSLWVWVGMYGVVGWAVAIPTLIGVALGLWIDTRFPSRYSWTLMLLLVGAAVGCLNAWHWVSRESRDDD